MKPPIREPSLSPTSSSLTRPPSCFDGYETNSPTRRPNSFDGYETIPPMARPPRTMRRSLQSCSDATSTDFEFWWERRSRSCAWLARHPSLIPEMCTAFEVAERCSRIIFQWIDRSSKWCSSAKLFDGAAKMACWRKVSSCCIIERGGLGGAGMAAKLL
jgi:hypothetical protein